MSELVPYIFQGHDVKVVMLEGEPIFSGADVCRVLGIKNVAHAITRLDNDEYMQVDSNIVSNEVGGRDPYFLNEPGLYSLIGGSRKAIAKDFIRWINHEVLPSIRKTGGYGISKIDRYADDPAMIAMVHSLETRDRVERVEVTLDEQGNEIKRLSETTTRIESEFVPKARAYDQFLASDGTLTLKQVADRFGIDNKGRKTFMAKLREMKILCAQRPEGGVSAYAQYYRKPTEYFVQKLDRREKMPWKEDETVGVTAAGVEFLARRLGILDY